MRRPLVLSTVLAALLAGASLSPAPAQARPAGPEARHAADAGLFYTNGDDVHVSSTPPATASGHGWWVRVKGGKPGEKAKVTIWLQAKDRHGKWRSVASGSKKVKPTKGKASSTHRANARKTCEGRRKTQWRSLIDVDVIGEADSPEKAVTVTMTFNCGAGV
ncbi:hypothetical protein ACIA74_22690 [Streptomyces sp. NPDC051658]|uniref:hypothetical protein n=1 Tax=Streptomyces sp. NPDC051658 TaxID=3365667 RepID=UPI003795D47E